MSLTARGRTIKIERSNLAEVLLIQHEDPEGSKDVLSGACRNGNGLNCNGAWLGSVICQWTHADCRSVAMLVLRRQFSSYIQH